MFSDSRSVDCKMGPWGEWSACSKTCNGQGFKQRDSLSKLFGFRYRQRTILINASNSGIPCGPQFDRQLCETWEHCN